MSFCKKCGAPRDETDLFCGKCGAQQSETDRPSRNSSSSRTSQFQNRQQPRREPFIPANKTDEGTAGIAKVVAAKQRMVQGWRKLLSVVALVLLLLAIFSAMMAASNTWTLPLALGFIATALSTFFVEPSAWTESEYYSVPASRDSSGDHRCIYCGHRGIYKHGAYKSDVEYADCSKCKKTLWES